MTCVYSKLEIPLKFMLRHCLDRLTPMAILVSIMLPVSIPSSRKNACPMISNAIFPNATITNVTGCNSMTSRSNFKCYVGKFQLKFVRKSMLC